MPESPLNDALRHFESVEANLVKAEKVLGDIMAAIPEGIAFMGDDVDYESNCRSFDTLLLALPAIDGWRPEISLMSLDAIAQSRLDAQELGEIDYITKVERDIREPSRTLREYRFRFDQKRRELIRDPIAELIDGVDSNLRGLAELLEADHESNEDITDTQFETLKENVDKIAVLMGSSVATPNRWSDLMRHLHFGMLGDLRDIINHDWPSVKTGLRKSMYGEKEPVPVGIDDIGTLVNTHPSGPVATKLKWEELTEDEFERLMFVLISDVKQYENPEWLMKTNAPDRGRDISVYRIYTDPLAGTVRHRVIIQCKHWLSKSVGPSEVAALKEQMKLWEPPRVDVHVIATSGRFTSDAVTGIEKHNLSDTALRIEMWPESHLERLLARRPAIIAEFGLR